MESDEAGNENQKTLDYEKLDIYSQLEVKLKARNKIICRREILLPCAHVEETDLSDILDVDNVPPIKPNRHLQDNAQSVNVFMENICKLKRTSELEMNFNIDEREEEQDEVSQTIARLRQQSEKLFKRIINCQVSFNECLTDNVENKDHKNKHIKLIEKTCQFDRGIDSIICCKEDKLETKKTKKLKIVSVEDFKNAYNDLALGVLTETFNSSMKTFKNHEHLLAIKQYNKPSADLVAEELIVGKLDPYTRQPITKPVRNKVCKHIYDQESINQMFQNKMVVHCPYIGCGNKHFTKADILFDLDISTSN